MNHRIPRVHQEQCTMCLELWGISDDEDYLGCDVCGEFICWVCAIHVDEHGRCEKCADHDLSYEPMPEPEM